MTTRRTCIVLVAWSMVSFGVAAQTTAEASFREALRLYVATWNRHEVHAWAEMLTEDVWYTEAVDFYGRMKGKKNVLAFFGDMVKTTDIAWDVKRVKMMPDGTASALLKHTALILPKTGDKYASTFVSDPSVSRWRVDSGKWRMFYFTSHKGSALVEMKKDGLE